MTQISIGIAATAKPKKAKPNIRGGFDIGAYESDLPDGAFGGRKNSEAFGLRKTSIKEKDPSKKKKGCC